ncbi:MAG TPA: MauE/DoxX family redox-associated membrane protein [Terriglobales bacterium]
MFKVVLLRSVYLVVAAIFTLSAMLKFQHITTAALGSEHNLLQFVYTALLPIGELALAATLVFCSKSVAVNACSIVALSCIVTFHSFKLLTRGDSGSCGCFGDWSLSSWLILPVAAACGCILIAFGPFVKMLLSFNGGCAGITVGSRRFFQSPFLTTFSGVAIGSTFIGVLSASTILYFMAISPARHDQEQETYESLRLVLRQLPSVAGVNRNRSVLLVRSSCDHCQQLLDQIAVALKHGVPPDVAQALLIVDLDGRASTTALPLKLKFYSLDQKATISVPDLPLLCQLTGGEVTSVRPAVSADTVLSSLATVTMLGDATSEK